MTLDERRMCIAYADMIQVEDLLQHVLRVDADKLLSAERRRDLASATLSLERVKCEIQKYVSEHTDYDGDSASNGVTEKRKETQNVGREYRDGGADSPPSGM
jgi:hypothetical protein